MEEPSGPVRVVRFGAFLADLRAGELHKNGHKIRLPEQPFQVLTMLLERPGEVVTREELQKRLWPADTFVDFDHGLNNAIKKLRDVLDDSAESPRYIETLPKRGYRFIHPVDASLGAGPQTAPSLSWWRRRWVAAALGAIIVATGLLAANVGGLRDRFFGSGPRGPIRSIAVLPLENLTGDPQQEFLVDGIHDELITHLAQIASLSVPSRTTVMRYKQQKKTMAEIARELGVDAIVEATVKRTSNGLRVTVQLIHAPTDRHLWANSFERGRDELAILPAAVARAIVGQLRIQLTPQEQARLRDPQSVHPEAYEAYLLGRHYFHLGAGEVRTKAKEYFEKAVEKDAGFARAYAALAEAYARGGPFVKDRHERRGNARKFAAKALELDETLAEAHTALAWVQQSDRDWEGAEREFQRAIELNPNYALAHLWYGWFLSNMQRFDEALSHVNRSLQLEPLSPFVHTTAAWPHLDAGKVDEAINLLQRSLRLHPGNEGSHTTLGFAFALKGEYGRATAALEKALELNKGGAFSNAMLAYCYAKTGQRYKAQAILNQLERRRARGENVATLALVYIHVALGKNDRAIWLLEKDFEEQRGGMSGFSVNPFLAPLRSDPRFTDLLRRLRLPPALAIQQGR